MRILSTKFYKDLSTKDELELILWLGYFEDSVNNSLIQKYRWKRNKTTWDLQMFFIAVRCIYEATEGLMKLGFFCGNEPEIWKAMTSFRDYFKKTSLKDLRDESIHRDWLYNQKSKQKRQLQAGKIIILGGLAISSQEYEYQFGIHKIKVLATFRVVETLARGIRVILDKKIKDHPDSMTYNKGMISWNHLRSFLRRRKVSKMPKNLQNIVSKST